jgi:hypothetical protein
VSEDKQQLQFYQQLQLYVPAGTRILIGDKYHLSPGPAVSIHYTLLQTLDINLITHFNCLAPFTVTSIWVELSSPSYFEIAVPNDPRWSSLPDAKVEVAEGTDGSGQLL